MAPVSTLSFKCALITGGSGGLGRAMAESIIAQGKSVIIAGRTESRLKQTAEEIGTKAYFVLDVRNTSSIARFIKNVVTKHPELDCVINNAGVQRPFQIVGPDYGFDLEKADEEIKTGRSFQSLINPVYNGTKAWVHFFTMNLRSQLRQAGSKIKVVEIVPPSVGTVLHRERKDPDDNKKDGSALSVPEFMKEIEEGWKEDRDICSAGTGKGLVDKWYEAYGEAYTKAGG